MTPTFIIRGICAEELHSNQNLGFQATVYCQRLDSLCGGLSPNKWYDLLETQA